MKKFLLVLLVVGLLVGLGGCDVVLGLFGIGNLSIGPNMVAHSDANGFLDYVNFTIQNEHIEAEQVWFQLIWTSKDPVTAQDEVFYLGQVNTFENQNVDVTITREQFNEWMDTHEVDNLTIDFGNFVVNLDPNQELNETNREDNRRQLGEGVLVSGDATEWYAKSQTLIDGEWFVASFYPAADHDAFRIECVAGTYYDIWTGGIAGSRGAENDINFSDPNGDPIIVAPENYIKQEEKYTRIKFACGVTGEYGLDVYATDPDTLAGYSIMYEGTIP